MKNMSPTSRHPLKPLLLGAIVAFSSTHVHALITKHIYPGGTSPNYPSITAAMNDIAAPLTDNIDIIVHAGTYTNETAGIVWPSNKTSSTYYITIKRAPGEARPVFDGGGANVYFLKADGAGLTRNVNFVIDGLNVVNYRSAFMFSAGKTGSYWMGNVTVKNCVMDNFTSDRAVIMLEHCRSCKAEDNVFSNFPNTGAVHAMYLTHGATNVSIKRNYVQNGAGDAFRFRNGSNNGVVDGNYSDRVGEWAGVTGYRVRDPAYQGPPASVDCWQSLSTGNTVSNNVFIYPFPGLAELVHDIGTSRKKEVCHVYGSIVEDCATCFTVINNIQRKQPAGTQTVDALAVADLDGDGMKEVVAAISADEGVSGRSLFRVVRSKLEQKWLGNLIFKANYTKITAMAAGHFSSGNPQLITAHKDLDNGPTTKIYRGSGVGGLNDLNLIWDGTGTGYHCTAMTAGDYDGDGDDDVVIALYNATTKTGQVWKSQGTTTSLGTKLWEGSWKILALATGNFDGTGTVELMCSRDYVGGSSLLFDIQRGDGVTANTGLTNLGRVWAATAGNEYIPTALAAGEYSSGGLGAGHELIAAFRRVSGGTNVYAHVGDGTTIWNGSTGGANNIEPNLYSTTTYTVPVMIGADVTSGSGDEVVTGFGKSDQSHAQISVGDGTSSPFNLFTAYKWPSF